MLPKLPAISDTISAIIETIVIIKVTIQAQPLPFKRPHATTKQAIAIAIKMPPSKRRSIPLIIISIAIIVTPIGRFVSNSNLQNRLLSIYVFEQICFYLLTNDMTFFFI